jgi:F0F1-type ATP synthase assembly protein I
VGTHIDPEPVDERDVPDAGEPATESWRETARSWAIYGHTGMMFPVATVLGALAGRAVDGWLGTSPWLALVGGALGVVAAISNLFRTVAAQEAREREERSRKLRRMRQQRRAADDDPPDARDRRGGDGARAGTKDSP